MTPAEVMGLRIRKAREERDVSVRELARRLVKILGASGERGQFELMRRYVARWESGSNMPSEHYRDAICDALGVPRSTLRDDEDEESSTVRVVFDLPKDLFGELIEKVVEEKLRDREQA